MRTRRTALVAPVLLTALATAFSACAPVEDDEPEAATDSSSADAGAETDPATCAADAPLVQAGRLTVGTDSPAYEPWFVDNDPTNGEGYESAVAYAVAEELGFSEDEVSWVTVPFNSSYAPGKKKFDFDINQVSITPARERVVDFSEGYYRAAQAVITLEDSPLAGLSTLEELAGHKLGAQTGTTSLTAIREVVQPAEDPLVFEDTNAAKQALKNGQVEAILADLPTAFYISAVEIEGSTIIGQFQPETGEQEEFGMLFEKGNPLRDCVDAALANLREDGTLADIEQQWLSDTVSVPTLD
ncbi:amino acid ABC transporter substrate-binding protein [Nocardioides sp. IC4_145]|uniref:ABC transporter substrate-binding protein n=1 Tax=Nocardioides sp. IC4_145 TaxID=2714037 RepID=UPI00140B55E4|nr:ABC transporter substrate-binding protein [Nocardioides sp. IC4_145]NHC21816.1 amino acid ABC transporter substrate-binding protein [Nocardioides sp. IC4_145]